MAKFIFSLGDANYRLLASEAKGRDITIQELIRAVIIPDWMRNSLDHKPFKDATTTTHTPAPSTSILPGATGILGRTSTVPNPIGRLKTS
jgi:hypothetical protein